MARRPRYSLLNYHGKALARRDGGWHCHYCWIPLKRFQSSEENKRGQGIGKATVDHKEALQNGGNNKLNNLVLCCERCNKEKGTMSYDRFYKLSHKRRQRRFAKRGISLGAIS